MSSITGLKTGRFTSIDNSGEIRLGTSIDAGTAGQALISNGSQQPAAWGTHTGIIQALTMGTNLSLASGNATFNGSVADTINAAGTTFTGGNGIDITGTTITTDNDGTTINNTGGTGAQNQVLKVPNALTRGTNISFSAGTTYDGSAAITISSTDTDTTYAGGNNISIDTTTNPDEIDLDVSITNMRDISYESGFFTTTLLGNDYPGSSTIATYLDLTSSTNTIHPPDVFVSGSDLRMTINLSNFMSNDDSTFYNIFSEDDGSAKIHGAIKPANAVVEMVGYFVIPQHYTATAARVDITDSGGSGITRDLTFESFTTYGATGFAALGTGPSGSEQSFSSNLVGATDKLLLIRINTTSTTDHVRGGYIKLTK